MGGIYSERSCSTGGGGGSSSRRKWVREREGGQRETAVGGRGSWTGLGWADDG